jgi:lysozyme
MTSAVDLVAGFEGFSSRVYLCSAGVPTCGFGATRDANGNPWKAGASITPAAARVLLERDLHVAEAAVLANVKVPITENMRVALVSFIFNVGARAFAKSTLLRLLNAGEPVEVVAEQFNRWNIAGGRVVPGLSRRRAAERELFLS